MRRPPAVVVTDPSDPRLADYVGLRRAPGLRRRESALDHVVVEGALALERALGSALAWRSVVVTPGRAAALGDLLARVPAGVPVLVAERGVLEEVTGVDVHRGVLASAQRPAPRDPHEVLGGARRVAVAEGISDVENMGAIFRVAAALGLDGVLLDPTCADPLYRRCIRVSLGWSTVVPHARLGALGEGLREMGAAGMRLVALTPAPGSTPVDHAAAAGLLDDPVALLVGAEGPGLSAGALAAADARVAVPMAEGADSLNVATSLAVVAAFAGARRGWDR